MILKIRDITYVGDVTYEDDGSISVNHPAPDDLNESHFEKTFFVFDELDSVQFGAQRRGALQPEIVANSTLISDVPDKYFHAIGYDEPAGLDCWPYHQIVASPRDPERGPLVFHVQTAAYVLSDAGDTLEAIYNGQIR